MNLYIDERADFGIIRYANCWEDADVLCAALEPAPGKRFLSIASAGDNSLALLAGGGEVVAVDLSPAQLACVELRMAAFRTLDYEDVLAFLGVSACSKRLEMYADLSAHMSSGAKRFWNEQQSLISAGIIHAGKFENYFHKFRAWIMPLVHHRQRIAELLQDRSAAARRQFYDRRWDTWRWRLLFRVFFSRFVMGRLGRDPEFFRYVEGSVADRILQRTEYALTELPTHTNPYLQYILTGNYGNALPRYLRAEYFPAIREGLDRLTLFQGTIEEAAAHFGKNGFAGFNLSDIFEYLDEPTCEAILEHLVSVGRAGARLAYWNMLVPRERPENMSDRLQPMEQLAAQLFARDLAFFYSRFVVEGSDLTPSAQDVVAGVVITLLFLAIVATAEAWRRLGNPQPESTRKLIHIAGGLVALSMPFVIESHWVVLAMAAGMATLFLTGKFTGQLRSLHGVARKSSGTEYYPVVIYLLFLCTKDAPWKYFICVLVLTTADAMAALVGSRYGRLRYQVDENFKSVEGSFVFLLVTFLAVFLPLATWPTRESSHTH